MTNGDEPVNAIFGTNEEPIAYVEFEGLTKREYFAAMALSGFAGNPGLEYLTHSQTAEDARNLADALIEALNTPGNPTTTETKSDDDKAGE
jgi:hypothetical protein